MMGRFLALTLSVEALFMLPAMLISLFCMETSATLSFLAAITLLALTAGVMYLLCKGAPTAFGAKEGLVCVSISWIVMSLFGCLPFWFSREIPSYVDALFEIVSGFTTTGSSILTSP